MPQDKNCGLAALEQFIPLKSVSMFTLIHLAKDNGINLHFCKVNPDELIKVKRPAIFHSEDHFVLVEDDKPIPEGTYDGYVLTPKPLREPLSHAEAKRIKGGKNVGGILQPIVTGLASLVNPVLGAAVGAGFGAARAGGAFGKEGKGEWWRIATGGLSGATAAGAPGLSALSAAAGELPGAIKSGNYMAPITAGLGQYGANVAAGGFGRGFSGAGEGAGFLGKLAGGGKGAISAFTGGGAQRGGAEIASRGLGGTTPAGYGGTYTVPGIGNRVVGIPGISGPAGFSLGAFGAAGGMSAPPSGGTSNLFSKFTQSGGQGIKGGELLKLGATSLLPPPKLQTDVTGTYSKAAQYLGGDQYKSLPTATRRQLEEYVNTPLDQLANKFVTQDDKGLRTIDEQKQKAIDAIMIDYANKGQDPYSSTQAQQGLTEINRQYDQAKAEYQQQIQNQAMTQAVSFKKEMLQNAMQQGQFDYESAMELATHMGREQEMKFALESRDYEQLQNLLAEIFSSSG